jgi:hypothetical protein
MQVSPHATANLEVLARNNCHAPRPGASHKAEQNLFDKLMTKYFELVVPHVPVRYAFVDMARFCGVQSV